MSNEQQSRVILILCPGGLANQGGVGRVIGYCTDVWSKTGSCASYEIIDTRGIASLLIAPVFFLKAILKVSIQLFRKRVELLHIHLSSYGSTCRKIVFVFLAKIFKVPVILHLHGSEYHIFFRHLPRIFRGIVKSMFRNVTQVIVLGQTWKRFVCQELGVAGEKVIVLPNAVFVSDTEIPTRSTLNCQILFLGRLGKRKGVSDLLAALATEEVRTLNWSGVIAGDGDIQKYIKEAEALGIKNRLDFPGWVNKGDCKKLLSSSDILVLPSYNEGLPLSVLEGMAHGLAVITTPVGAIPEVIKHEVNGLLVPAGNCDELARALGLVIVDSMVRSMIAKNAKEHIVKHHNITTYAGHLSQLYQHIR